MTDNNLSKLLDKGLIRVKKRKSPKKKSISSEKYSQFLHSHKKGRTPIQKIMKQNIVKNEKKIEKLQSKPLVKKLVVVDKQIQPIFKINRKVLPKKKTKLKRKPSKSKRKPRKVTIRLKKGKSKKINVEHKESKEMVDELHKRGISITGKSDRLVRDIYMCIVNDNIEIKKE